jgi:pSer/pThr/pTyr-binding forkhead associated (FHA) protein
MADVKLTVCSSRHAGATPVPMKGSRLTIGADDSCAIRIKDDHLAPVHASVHREGEEVWILEEQARGAVYVNDVLVAPGGTPLEDGDRISLGPHTVISVSVKAARPAPGPRRDLRETRPAPRPPRAAPRLASVVVVTCFLLGAGVFVTLALMRRAERLRVNGTAESASGRDAEGAPPPATPPADVRAPDAANGARPAPPDVRPTQGDAPAPDTASAPDANPGAPLGRRGLYKQLKTEEERLEYVGRKAQHVALMIGNRPYAFTPKVVELIKRDVDAYEQRIGNRSKKMWGEDLNFMFARAREQYAPQIIRAFNARGVPPVIGLYLVVIETEYRNIAGENRAHAAGLFQFIPDTARHYHVDPSERTDVSKMAPAAADYMADRIAEFGTDSMSVALGIAGYNRSPDSVRRDLRDVLNSDNKERSFWTLIANTNKLDHHFRGENVKYVPKFFAAAIIGEHPQDFGLDMRPLSTYTEVRDAPHAPATPRP